MEVRIEQPGAVNECDWGVGRLTTVATAASILHLALEEVASVPRGSFSVFLWQLNEGLGLTPAVCTYQLRRWVARV